MARRVYIVPQVGTGTLADPWTPAYIPSGVVPFSQVYGGEGVFATIVDVTPSQHAAIAANSPITVVPADLSSTVGAGNLAAVQDALESWNIPGQWVTAAMTYRTVLRGVVAIFQFANKFQGLHRLRIFRGGITLATTVAELTTQQRNQLAAVSDAFGWDRSGVTGSTTMRQLIRGAAQQWAGSLLLGIEVL